MIGGGFLNRKNGIGNKGFTLVEVLATIAILGIVISIYSSLYYSGYKAYDNTQKNIDVEQNVRYAMNYIVDKINQSENKNSISPYTDSNGNSGIKIDDQNIILYNNVKHTIYAYGNNGNEIAVNIYGLKVIQKNNNMIYIEITGHSKNSSNTYTLSTDVFLRK